MSGTILQAARADARAFITAGGFEEDITITTPSGAITLNTTGWATKHHLSYDTDGTAIHSKNAHITLDEKALVDQGYPVRENEEVALMGHTVKVKDNSGVEKDYIITRTFPDETLGLIDCLLGDLVI